LRQATSDFNIKPDFLLEKALLLNPDLTQLQREYGEFILWFFTHLWLLLLVAGWL